MSHSDDLSYARQYYVWLTKLPEDQRCTALLAYRYEQERRAVQGSFYRALPNPNDRTVKCKNFKTFDTVRKWLAEHGLEVGLRRPGWKKYLSFVFRFYCPADRPDALPPMPAQLKNPVLLRRFCTNPTVVENPKELRSADKISSIYEKIADMVKEDAVACSK